MMCPYTNDILSPLAAMTYWVKNNKGISVLSPTSVYNGFNDTKNLVINSNNYIEQNKKYSNAASNAWYYGNIFENSAYTPGKWYLPSVGEWWFIAAYWATIQMSLYILKQKYTRDVVLLKNNQYYWTSTMFHDNYMWAFNAYNSSFESLKYTNKGITRPIYVV